MRWIHIGEINYDIDWLVEKTDYLLKDSNVLLLSYDFDEEPKKIDILKGYLENYRERNIIILPEGVAEENKGAS